MEIKMQTENDVTLRLAEYLRTEGYRDINHLTTIQRGIDLVATDPDGVIHYVEVKGETSASNTSSRYGKAFTINQINNHVARALLATFKAMDQYGNDGAQFGMAFPENEGHLKVLATIKETVRKLAVKVYLVSENGVRVM